MVEVSKYLNQLYPNIYQHSTNPEIQALIYIQNYIIQWVNDEIESRLQKWTVTEGVSEEYLKQLFQRLHLPYVDHSCLSLLKKKNIINQSQYERNVADFLNVEVYDEWWFEEDKPYLITTIDNVNKVLTLRIKCEKEIDTWERCIKYQEFLTKWTELLAPANFKVYIDIQYYYNFEEYLMKRPQTTIQEIIDEYITAPTIENLMFEDDEEPEAKV